MSCPSGMPNSGRGGVVASTLRLSLAPRRFRPVRSPWGSVASSISARKPSQTVLQLPVDSPPLELHDGIDDHLEDGELTRALQESVKNEHSLCQNVLLGGVFSYVTPSVQ